MRFFAVCLVAVSLPAAAQRLPGSGTEAPLDSGALFDDGSSLDGNPGGLGFVRGLELHWLHDSAYQSNQNRSEGFLLTGGAGGFTLGAGLDFLNRQTFACDFTFDNCINSRVPSSFRRVSLGLGLELGQLGPRAFSYWIAGMVGSDSQPVQQLLLQQDSVIVRCAGAASV